ncbi:MAG: tetratricopeptide repeat protein [Ignavibacteriales bacterium]|nr:tetratricopeptide repeat protein [Ignavibacteriales bacterium]
MLSLLPKTDEKDKAALLAQIAYHYKDRDPAHGLIHAAEAVKFAKSKGDFLAEGTAYSAFSINYINLNNYDSAVTYALKAKELGEKHKLPALLGDANNYIGLVFYFLGNGKQAMVFYTESLRHRKIENDPDKLSKIHNNISLAHRMNGDFKQAESFLRISIELKRQLKDELSLARSFSNLAFIYRQKKDYKTGLQYLDTALALCVKNKYEAGKAVCLDNYADIYADRGEIEKAIETIRKVVDIYKNAKDIRGECSGLLKLAGYEKRLKHYPDAAEKLLEVVRLAGKLNITNLLTGAYIELFYVYKEMGDEEGAMKYAEVLISRRDSLFTQSIYNNILLKSIDYEIRLKDKEIQSLFEKQELLDLQNQKRFMTLLVIAAIFFLLLLSFIVIYRQKRQSHKVTQDMINSVTDPFMLLNADTGEVILRNQPVGKRSFKDIDFSDKITDERLNRIKNEKLPLIEEASYTNSKGEEFFFNLNFYPVKGNGDSIERIVLYAANTTDIKLAEKTILSYLQKLRLSEEELKKSNDSKDQLISIIGHDLRNPFVLLINIADILIDDYDTMTNEENLNFSRMPNVQRLPHIRFSTIF